MVLQLSLLLHRKDIKKPKLNIESCMKRKMTRSMLNLLCSISYDCSVCCEEELAPAISASVRSVGNTYWLLHPDFFSLAKGIARSWCWVVIFCSVSCGGQVLNGGPPALCRGAVCACWRRAVFSCQAVCSVVLVCGALQPALQKHWHQCVWADVWYQPMAVPGLGSDLVSGEITGRGV